MLRVFATAALCVASLAGSARADANSLTDHFGPREIAIGESMRADARGHLSTTLNPAGLALGDNLVFEGTYGFRPGDSASAIAVSACDATVAVPGCFYYNYFSAEPEIGGASMSRRSHQFGMTAARPLTPRVLVGVNSKYFDYNSNLDGEEDASGFAFDAGLILRATNTVSLAGVGYNLIAADSPQYPRALGTGITVRPGRLAIGLDAVWNLEANEGEKGGRYGLGAEYFLLPGPDAGYPLRAGVVRDSGLGATFVTAGLGYVTPKLGIDVGARREVGGGDELMVHAGIRIFGPSVPR
jgi:hypothetical protein